MPRKRSRKRSARATARRISRRSPRSWPRQARPSPRRPHRPRARAKERAVEFAALEEPHLPLDWRLPELRAVEPAARGHVVVLAVQAETPAGEVEALALWIHEIAGGRHARDEN